MIITKFALMVCIPIANGCLWIAEPMLGNPFQTKAKCGAALTIKHAQAQGLKDFKCKPVKVRREPHGLDHKR